VLIGNVDEEPISKDDEAREGYAASRLLPNIHYLKPVPEKDVPAYAANMDVNAISYRIRDGEWGFACYPLKLHEYLAVGKPVVSASIAVIRQKFSSVVSVADTPQDWEAAINHALTAGGVGTVAMRQAVAADNSWDRRVDCLEDWLRSVVSESARPTAAA
jgi:glycosyltransferase involved in cell wall biosynthesis